MAEETFARAPFDRTVEQVKFISDSERRTHIHSLTHTTCSFESFDQVSKRKFPYQAIMSIKKGAYLLKCGHRGKSKFCPFRLSMDEKFLIWYSGLEEKRLCLSSVTQIFPGLRNVKLSRQVLHDRGCQSLSLVHADGARSLDLICKDKAQAGTWFLGLRALICRSKNHRSFSNLRNCKGMQSCVNSPAGFMRRKYNLGLLDDNVDLDQVRSFCGSPFLSLSERCYSDGLSYTSESLYSSESVLSNVQNLKKTSILNYAYSAQGDISKNGCTHAAKNESIAHSSFSTYVSAFPSIANSNSLKDVMVWGESIEKGISGSGVTLPRLLESAIMLDVESISFGGKHAALVTKQGELFCWGSGKGGRLGHKVEMDFSIPKIVDSLCGIHVKYAACGEYHTCALTKSGEVYMWGDISFAIALADKVNTKSHWIPRRLSGPLDGLYISTVACGEWHTAIASSCGRLFTYGEGTFGALGHGNLLTVSQPREVESLKGLWVRSVACGSWHTAALVDVIVDRFKYSTVTGKLFTWGDGDHGQLGHADSRKKLLPASVAQLMEYDFIQVSCGRMLTVALTNFGKVFTMGSALHGQLGNPQAKDRSIAVVEGNLKLKFVKGISSGSYHVAVLTSDGGVYTWGKNKNGQLGVGDTEDRTSPTIVEALGDRLVESIICGSHSTAAICLHRPISAADQSACNGCKSIFGLRRKKHNCYNCGLFFCHSCSIKKVTNASLALNKKKAFRVCDQCFDSRQRIDHSETLTDKENSSFQQPWSSQKMLPVRHEVVDEATTEVSLLSKRTSCKKGHNLNRQHDIQLNSENISSLTPRWGQVPCPMLFNSQNMDEHECPAKIKQQQEYVNHAESSSTFRGHEAEKHKPQLHKLPEQVTDRIEGNLGEMHTGLLRLTPIRTGCSIPKYRTQMVDHAPLSTEVRLQKDRKPKSPFDSPSLFSASLKSKLKINTLRKGLKQEGNSSHLTEKESQQEKREGSKHEWVEQYEPGVYITFTVLPNGQVGLKRVRFSRKRFAEKEAQLWWERNQVNVYQKYQIEGYADSNKHVDG